MACGRKNRIGKAIDWQERRAAIAAGALPLFLERPWSSVSVEDIAAHLGISYWQVYYSFDGLEDIYRACVARLVDRVEERIAAPPPTGLSVNRTIQDYVRHAADIVGSDSYQHLLFLRLRDEHTDPWIKTAYEGRIAEPLRAGLETAVATAGESNDLSVVLLHGMRERYLMMLEAALALPRLLQRGEFVDETFERTVSTVAKDVFTATCTFDGFDQASAAA